MKITSIEVEGLWLYREHQRVDLSDLPMVVGVGENGAGKSSLLVSSVIAALYGRLPTKTAQESISDGSNRGTVSVEFETHGTKYRVGRTFARKGSSSGYVMVEDPAEQSGWRSLCENGMREVTEKAVEIIGMDYETATMTWIAEQGQYGKFAAAQPATRFKLLSSVFGLDEYTARAKAASRRAAAEHEIVTGLDGRIHELGEAIDDEKNGAPDEYAGVDDKALESRATSVSEDIDRINVDIAEIESADPSRKLTEKRQELQLIRQERLSAHDSAEQRLRDAENRRAESQERAERSKRQSEERRDRSIAGAKSATESAREQAKRSQEAAIRALAEIAAAERDLPDIQAKLEKAQKKAKKARKQARTLEDGISTAQAAKGELLADLRTLRSQLDEAEERLAATRQTDGDAECYTCGQHLSTTHLAEFISVQENVVADFKARIDTVKSKGAAAKDKADKLTSEREALIEEAEARESKTAELRSTVERMDTLIASKPERQSTADDSDIAVTRAVKAEAEAIDAAETEYAEAIAAADEERAAAARNCEEVQEKYAPIRDANAAPTERESKLADKLAKLEEEIAGEVATVNARRSELVTERENLHTRMKRIAVEQARRARVAENVAALNKKLEGLVADRDKAQRQFELNSTLVKAYSPTGIPAMILSGVVDSINESVNQALEVLSRGELTVRLSTTRDTAAGGQENKVSVYVETPDGTRSYEALSGGQKFRVDLAIRTGLAKTVARGTESPVETFILDEGWGSLDEKGLHSTVETLFRLSESTNVITVSHIDAVRDAFPARVEVSLRGRSSHAEVVAG